MRFCKFIFFLLLFFSEQMFAEQLYFDHYTTKNGLCCDFILGVNQDDNGFIWVVTQDGVSRFDGTRFKNYSTQVGGLLRNDLLCITNIEGDGLMIGGDRGVLQSYERQTDSFVDRRFPDLMTKYVKSVVQFSKIRNGKNFLLSTSGVFCYNNELRTFDKDSILSDSTLHLFVKEFYQDWMGNYWVGAFDGLHLFSREGKELKFYPLSKDNAPTSSILEIDSSKVLVSTNMGGVWLFEISREGLPQARELKTPFRNVSTMLKDSNNRVWFGTWGDGLWRMDRIGEYEEVYSYGSRDDLQKVHCLFEDSEHSIWIGTQVNGLFRLHREGNDRVVHSSEMGYPKVDASCFVEREDGSMYVGTDGAGVFVVSSDGKFMGEAKDFSCMGSSVLSFYPKGENQFIVSSWFSGIGEVNADGIVTQIPYKGLKNTVNSTKSVRMMRNGEVWVATQGDGVYIRQGNGVWRKESFIVNEDVSDRWIDDMEETEDETRWIISPFYIWKCDSIRKKCLAWEDTLSISEPCIFLDGVCDTIGNLYVASNYGIIRVLKENEEMSKLSFLPESKYSSVYFDDEGFLWCSGSSGICRVNVENKTYKVIPIPQDKYGKLYFLPRSIYENSKGNMFFGCSNGFILLNPKNFEDSNPINSLAWTTIRWKGEDKKIKTSMIDGCCVELNPDNEEVCIGFDLVALSDPAVNCRYRIRGIADEWTDIGVKREIVITHLPSGKHELELGVFKSGGEKICAKISLSLDVEDSWWSVWWIFVIGFVILIISFLGVRWVKRKRSANEAIQLKADNQERAQDPFLSQVMQVIEENYADSEFSVEELASQLNMSKSTLIRKLKPLTEETPIEMISECRLKRADEMLRMSDTPVKEVAFRTGFSSPYYFSRKYKEYFGYPPSQNKDK